MTDLDGCFMVASVLAGLVGLGMICLATVTILADNWFTLVSGIIITGISLGIAVHIETKAQ